MASDERFSTMNPPWPAEAIWQAVSPTWPDFTVEILPEIDSTNSELMRRARLGRLEPTLLVAEHQTAGRGRLGREWLSSSQSDGASLTFSLGLPFAPTDWYGLSLAVGLSLVESLHPTLQLKWPNDIWLQGRKLAGILIETVSVGDVRFAVVGVGINILPRDGTGLQTAPAALTEVLPETSASTALRAVVPRLVQTLQRFELHGFAELRSAFHARDLLYGQTVLCSDNVTGIARGVDANGALMVHTAQGLIKISSAEVSIRPASTPPLTNA